MKKLIRKTWPKIRAIHVKGELFYQVDARRKGTAGKREAFSKKADAEKRAAEIEADFTSNGSEGLALPVELRAMALQGARILQPFGKTILQAAEFYRVHLVDQMEKEGSAVISTVADEWLADKKSGKTKKLRTATLTGIKQTAEDLKAAFGNRRILEISKGDIEAHLDSLNAGLRRKFNVRSLFSQFFNWAIKKGYTKQNPAKEVEIHVGGKEVRILTPEQARQIMELSVGKYPDFILYHAISLFAGLRPSECIQLRWENVHLKERTITVLAETSKTKETRNVPIEANLLAWLVAYSGEKRLGAVTRRKNFENRIKEFRAKLGYRCNGQNEESEEWQPDIMRHSYGSYWLGRHKDRAHLAENMGNSLDVIKRHYKQVVSNSACASYWAIVPESEKQKAASIKAAIRRRFATPLRPVAQTQS